MKWFQSCAFCDMKPHVHVCPNGYCGWDKIHNRERCHLDKQVVDHQPHCVFAKVLRAAKWAQNGLLIVLDGRRAELPENDDENLYG